MENIKLSSRDKPGHHHRSTGNLHVLLPSHRQTSHHSHRQRLTLTIGTNASPLLDLVTFSCLFIGNHPHRQLPCRPFTVAPSCRSILYRSLGTCPKTVSTVTNSIVSIKPGHSGYPIFSGQVIQISGNESCYPILVSKKHCPQF